MIITSSYFFNNKSNINKNSFHEKLFHCQNNKIKYLDESCNNNKLIENIPTINNLNIIFHRFEYPLFNNLPSINDIKQGRIGDCYLLTALALLVNMDLIEDIFVEKNNDNLGIYGIKYFYKGEWKIGIIDNTLPSYYSINNYKPIFADCNNSTWVSLIEKFWAKFNHSYKNISVGCVSDFLNFLTGSYSFYLKIQNKNLDYMWELIIYYMKNDLVYTYEVIDKSILKNKHTGLLDNHSYAIINYKIINNIRFIQLHNPWGFYFWKSDTVNKYNLNDIKQRGTFWMTFDEFYNNFKMICINQVPQLQTQQLSFYNNTSTEQIYLLEIMNNDNNINKIYGNFTSYDSKNILYIDIIEYCSTNIIISSYMEKNIGSFQFSNISNKYIIKPYNKLNINFDYWITIYCDSEMTLTKI